MHEKLKPSERARADGQSERSEGGGVTPPPPGVVDSAIIAALLQISERHARRILDSLAARGALTYIGPALNGRRGRPRKLWRIPANPEGE